MSASPVLAVLPDRLSNSASCSCLRALMNSLSARAPGGEELLSKYVPRVKAKSRSTGASSGPMPSALCTPRRAHPVSPVRTPAHPITHHKHTRTHARTHRRQHNEISGVGVVVWLWDVVEEVTPAQARVLHGPLHGAGLTTDAPVQVEQHGALCAEGWTRSGIAGAGTGSGAGTSTSAAWSGGFSVVIVHILTLRKHLFARGGVRGHRMVPGSTEQQAQP